MGNNRVRRRIPSQTIVGITTLAVLALAAGAAQASFLNSCTIYCHGIPPRDGARKSNPHFNSQSSAFLGNHRNHLPATPVAADCSSCHIPVALTDFGHENEIIAMVNSIKGYSSASIRARYDKGRFVNQTSVPNLVNATCSNINCHFETKSPAWGSTAFSFPASCNACHGAPPAGSAGAPVGGLAGSHARHDAYFTGATGCQKCHPGYTGFTHATSAGRPLRVQGYLRDPLNTLETGATYSGAGVNYLPSKSVSQLFGSCTNLYCHSNSGPNATAITYSPATWNSGNLTCASCHANMATTASTAPNGNHYVHASTAYASGPKLTCSVCHGLGYNSAAVTPATHVNRRVELSFTGSGVGTTYSKSAPITAGTAWGSCTAPLCHGSGSPVWGGTLWSTSDQCGKCHSSTTAGAVTQAVPFYSTSYPGKVTLDTNAKVGAHTNHLISQGLGISASNVCSDCHGTVTLTGTEHMNGSSTFAWSSLATRAGTLAPVYTIATGQCTATYCHGNSMPGGDTTGSNKAPVWNNPNYLPATISGAACGTCHGFPPSAASGHPGGITIPTGFPATATIGTTCSCHANINTGGNSYANIFVNPALHINGIMETPAGGHSFPYGGSLHLGAAGTTPWAGCTGCHTNVAGGIYPVAAGTAPNCTGCHINGLRAPSGTSSCWDCHGPSATDGRPNGNLFPNVSGSHTRHVVGLGLPCATCHDSKGGGINDPTHGSSNRVAHNSAFVNVTSTTQQFHFTLTGKGSCSNVACHGPAEWGVTKFNCITCHSVAIGSRVAVTGQFASQSHHVQGAELPLTNAHCAKCHWEAKADGSTDPVYHSGTSGKGVSLIVWNGTTRPVTAIMGTTYISYTANGSRDQISKLNQVCLGCHNSANIPAANLFGAYASDQYSPEPRMLPALAKTSILSRYSSTRTVPWSNYSFTNSSGNIMQYGTNMKKNITKALSAHGNATRNQFPAWDATLNGKGEDETTADIAASATLSSRRIVLCYDCHNSHGSDAAGITSSYSSATGRYKGGLLKSTIAGKGGYNVTYKPAARTINYKAYSTTATTAATFNAGASICHDCHNNDTRKVNISKPWSIINTYSSTRPIVGYWSTPYFDNYTGTPAKRFPYKGGGAIGSVKDLRKPMGGHFATSIIGARAVHSVEINGLCTPCHDPHGVSSAMTVVNRGKSVPLLKGTWVTSPYREDRATPVIKRGGGSNFTGVAAIAGMPGYSIDQNTLINLPAPVSGGGGVTSGKSNRRAQVFTAFPGAAGNALSRHTEKTPADFAGLCIGCHAQNTLTNANAPSAVNWMSKERVHQSVAGWAATTGTNANNTVHAFTCSKCHKAHTSHLPRLMVTDCLDVRHVKQSVAGGSIPAVPTATSPGFSFGNVLQSYASSAYGAGRFPAGGSRYSSTPSSAQNNGPWYFQTVQPATPSYGSNCHNSATAGGAAYDPTRQMWNRKTRW